MILQWGLSFCIMNFIDLFMCQFFKNISCAIQVWVGSVIFSLGYVSFPKNWNNLRNKPLSFNKYFLWNSIVSLNILLRVFKERYLNQVSKALKSQVNGLLTPLFYISIKKIIFLSLPRFISMASKTGSKCIIEENIQNINFQLTDKGWDSP